jgi:hypothetical protein
MFKNFILCVMLLILGVTTALCLSPTDTITMAARRDAKNFRLSDSLWKANRQAQFSSISDYFKPTKTNVKDTALLIDSAYVQAFRYYAYKQNKRRRTAGHHILVGVEVAAGIAVVLLAAIIIFVAPTMGN